MADPVTATIVALGTVLKAGSAVQQGEFANKLARSKASQLDAQGKAAVAGSHRDAENIRRDKEIMISRQRAVAAAGGGSVSDVGMMDAMGDVEKAHELNALTALFEGKTRDQDLRFQGRIERANGKQKKKQGYLTAATTLMSQMGQGGSLHKSSFKS